MSDRGGVFSGHRWFAGGARRFLSGKLKSAGVENSLQEADWILSRLLNVSRAKLFACPERILTDSQVAAAMKILRRRASGEPLQYILNEAYFWGLRFEVGKGVLVPRPETELLVELALELLPRPFSPIFLDWGTGSGCIAIAMLLERPDAKAFMAEKNPLSLRWAWENIGRHGLQRRAFLWHSREAEDIPSVKGALDMVVGNPPYIPTKDIGSLMREVRDHEPHLALDGGEDGLDFYRTLFRSACGWLKPEGTLVLEIGGADQAAQLRRMPPPCLSFIKEVSDYAGIPRCMAWRYFP
ncbi:MAG: peptide chain release factor N(5)-glutamine methyltransferase [Synergistaceae bacterium]|jgi:release factor glutamine methyltransferase|nr:peptide chain release factor N(5)-glutamine methyltransferase [Synergistaceae bacterium]